MPTLAKKWTRENPYIYIDKQYPRRMVIFWEDGKMIETTYARWLWVKKVGPIPKGKTIHHKNGKKLDDRIPNYKLMTHSEHSSHHMKMRQKAKLHHVKKDPNYEFMTKEDHANLPNPPQHRF